MADVDNSDQDSVVIPLRCPPALRTGTHRYINNDDVGVCRFCGVESGTAAATWPCGYYPTPAIRTTFDGDNNIARVELVNAVDPLAITEVLEQVDRWERATELGGDSEYTAARDLALTVRWLIERLPTT